MCFPWFLPFYSHFFKVCYRYFFEKLTVIKVVKVFRGSLGSWNQKKKIPFASFLENYPLNILNKFILLLHCKVVSLRITIRCFRRNHDGLGFKRIGKCRRCIIWQVFRAKLNDIHKMRIVTPESQTLASYIKLCVYIFQILHDCIV